jgi:hypothetical protein
MGNEGNICERNFHAGMVGCILPAPARFCGFLFCVDQCEREHPRATFLLWPPFVLE